MLFSAIVADPHDVTRRGVRQLVEDLGGRVAAETETPAETVSLVATVEPDLLVLELSLQSGYGFEVLAQIRNADVVTLPLILTDRQDHVSVKTAFRLGARGFVLKGDPPGTMEAALRDVLAGRRRLSDRFPERLMGKRAGPDEGALEAIDVEEAPDPFAPLTDRERQVLRLTAEGLTAVEIGERLSISPRTVEKHQENIRDKLYLESRAAMVRVAVQYGLVESQMFASAGAPVEADKT